MAAGNYDIITIEGGGVALSLVYKDDTGTPIDISSYTPYIDVTDNKRDNETITTFTGAFVTDGTDGAFTLNISPSEATALGWFSGRFVIKLVDDPAEIQLVYGKLQIKKLKY